MQIVGLSCAIEVFVIDNLLWSQTKTDSASLFPHLICRTLFKARRHRLQPFIKKLQAKVAEQLNEKGEDMAEVSIPMTVVKLALEKTCKALKEFFKMAPAKGYRAVNRC